MIFLHSFVLFISRNFTENHPNIFKTFRKIQIDDFLTKKFFERKETNQKSHSFIFSLFSSTFFQFFFRHFDILFSEHFSFWKIQKIIEINFSHKSGKSFFLELLIFFNFFCCLSVDFFPKCFQFFSFLEKTFKKILQLWKKHKLGKFVCQLSHFDVFFNRFFYFL